MSLAMSKRKRLGILVRVKREIEEIVREAAFELGYSSGTIRNAALLYGLIVILGSRQVPRSDEEFLGLLRTVRVVAEYSREYYRERVAGSRGRYVKRVKKKEAVVSAT